VVHDFGTHEGSPYVLTELLEGETLREQVSRGALPVRTAIDYAVQVARGLAAAHQKGIVHRDLKPENLFITVDGRVKILDFGLAKLTQVEVAGLGSSLPTTPAAAAGRPDTTPGMVLGTIGYMSPEQVKGLPADHRADVFALGTILYEMVTGRRAFKGESTVETMTAILRDQPPDLAESDRPLSPALRIVEHCLESARSSDSSRPRMPPLRSRHCRTHRVRRPWRHFPPTPHHLRRVRLDGDLRQRRGARGDRQRAISSVALAGTTPDTTRHTVLPRSSPGRVDHTCRQCYSVVRGITRWPFTRAGQPDGIVGDPNSLYTVALAPDSRKVVYAWRDPGGRNQSL
jgi:serine/threonine protein kinase